MLNELLDAGPTIGTTWPQLKQMAGEFFRALPEATDEEAEAGLKCLSLGYLGLEANALDQHQAELLMQIVGRKVVERGASNKQLYRKDRKI
jgi:hypothetical protein